MNLPETGAEAYNWTEGIYQLELNDLVEGGLEGISNRQARQLALRTRNLHARLLELEAFDPETIVQQLRDGVNESLDTLKELADYVDQQVAGIDNSAITNSVLATLRGGVANELDTLEKLRAWVDRMLFGSSALEGTAIDFEGLPVRTKTLTADTALSYVNLKPGRTITLRIDGDYALTFPATTKPIVGEYDRLAVNLVQLICISAGEVWSVISQEA